MIATDNWKVLVVDDEPNVREITRIVLEHLDFDGRGLEILEAGSAREGREVLAKHRDIALMIVDVVMEDEHAGLGLVRYVRDDLANRLTRIVLRTGHPGQAPEREVIRAYDINDYKEKTELTSHKLETTVYVALRGYRDLMTIEAARQGLERVVEASAEIHSRHNKSHEFASAVLAQLAALVGLQRGALYCTIPKADHTATGPIQVTAATGAFEPHVAHPIEESLPDPLLRSFREAYDAKHHVFGSDHYVLYFTDAQDSENLLIVAGSSKLSELDLHLIKVFCTNVGIAFENVHLHQDLIDSQLEMVCLLAGAAETRSKETANHVKRVGLLAEFFARELGLDDHATEALQFAAPLHDIGKIAIPDAILNKPGSHTDEESKIMRTHAERGAQLLAQSRLPLIRLAAEIAATHHENWDGSGYPRGLKGEDIPLSGRVTALADVYDALGSRRCYKEAWTEDRIVEFIRNERGRKFDPKLVDILLDQLAKAEAIRQMLPD
jgi:putative nucleotidyltransferase with HDIG domain